MAAAGDAVGRAVAETDAAGDVVGAVDATVRRVPVRYLQKVSSRLRMWSPATEKVVARVIAAAGTGGRRRNRNRNRNRNKGGDDTPQA